MSEEPDPYPCGDRVAIAFVVGVALGIVLAFGLVWIISDVLNLVCQTLPDF